MCQNVSMLEVIAKSLKDVVRINNSRADRIEYCRDLEHDGLTPNLWKVKFISSYSELPIMVIVRNHYDNFEINEEQLKRVVKQIKKIEKTHTQGIVWGAITKDKQIDMHALRTVIENLGKLDLTFHKAFDLIEDKVEAAKILRAHGVTRILTAGGKGSPLDNLETLKQIKEIGIEILVGGQVDWPTARKLSKQGFKNLHIGRAARERSSWKKDIKVSKINDIKKLVP